MDELRGSQPLRYPDNDRLQPQEVLAASYAHCRPPGIVVADLGLNQIWATTSSTGDEAGTFLNSGGAGTMVFTLRAALGARAADPTRRVWAICGKGGFVMTLQELATAVEAELLVKVAILNNGQLA